MLAVVTVLWILIALFGVLAGEYLLAGFCLLATSLTIYLRETRA